MGFSLKQKIALAFLLSSIAVLGMMFSVTQYVFQTEFSKYITTTHKKQDRDILTYLTETVNREGGLNTENLWLLEHQSMTEGFLVIVYNSNMEITWDNKKSYAAMYGDTTDASQLHELIYPIRKDTETIGYLSISRNFSNFFSPEDIGFQRALYSGLLTVAAASILGDPDLSDGDSQPGGQAEYPCPGEIRYQGDYRAGRLHQSSGRFPGKAGNAAQADDLGYLP